MRLHVTALDEGTARRARMIALSFVFAFAPRTSAAESLVTLKELIPPMLVRVCWTFDAAVGQAKLSRLHAQESTYRSDKTKDFEHSNCVVLNVPLRVDAIETRIHPFIGWAPTYDPSSSKTVPTIVGERSTRVEIPFTVSKTPITYYRATILYRDELKDPWVELPPEPYVLKYFQLRGRPQ